MKLSYLFFCIMLVSLAIAPLFLSSYWQSVLITFLINAILIMSYRLITTMGGWSFAHIAIMGIGAYTSGLMMTMQSPWGFWSSAFAAIIVTTVFAAIISYPVLRTRAYYFFLSTFAASEAIRQSFIQFSAVTGGTNGVPFIPRPSDILGFSLQSNMNFYLFLLAITTLVGMGFFILDKSHTGRTIKAVAANEDLSTSLGMNCWGYRTLAFVIGSAVAGLAGALLASFNGIINPSDFNSTAMFKLVAAAIVGGTTTFVGPLLGLIYLTVLEEFFRNQASWVPLLWGVSVIAVLLFTKGGIETLLPSRKSKHKKVKEEETPSA